MWFNPHAFLQKQGDAPSKVTKVPKVGAATAASDGTLDSLDTLDTLTPAPEPPREGAGPSPEGIARGLELYQKHTQYPQNPGATVTSTPIARPGKSSRPFLVAIDGTTCCPSCGLPGQIPHHLSLIFWRFWTRAQLAALVEAIRPDERLAWLAKGLVRVEGAAGQSRELREVGGRWDEVPK